MKNIIPRFAIGIPLLASLGSFGQESQKQTKPNILFILADDQTFETLGALNNPEIHTPNLDKLIKSGACFTQAYIQGSWCPAVCVASRASLITGSYVWKAAQYSAKANISNKNTPKNMPKYTVIPKKPAGYWPLFMKEAGYETYMAGKWHIEEKAEKLFDHLGTVRGGMPNQTEECYDRKFIEKTADTWKPYDKSFGGHWEGGKHWSEVLCEETMEFLKLSKESKNPFFMYIAFSAPHDPRQSPKEYVDMYPLDKISIPRSFMPVYPYCEEIGSGKSLRDERLAPFPRTEYAVKVTRQEYYAIVSHLDYQIGRIIEKLHETGQDKNTYIIFAADNGLAAGDHGFMGKQNMYDRSMRVPLIIVGPNVKKDSRVDEFVYLQDIMPTTLEIARAPKPSQVDYNTLLPLATGKTKKSVYDAVYGTYMGSQRMIRNKKYKMMIYPKANLVRLYNMENDPFEMHDLAADATYKPVMDELFVSFKKLQTEVADPLDVSSYYDNFFRNK
ncbi:MAG: sulfatase-like hydrolase/transferase [Mariniphaga sp.]